MKAVITTQMNFDTTEHYRMYQSHSYQSTPEGHGLALSANDIET